MSAIKDFHHNEIEQGQRDAIADTRDYPILFDTQMVQAIVSGKKTATRRLIKNIPITATAIDKYNKTGNWTICQNRKIEKQITCPYGEPGDLLWVKETWAPAIDEFAFKADYTKEVLEEKRNKGLWKPSIHMPKTAARLWLQITDVQAQRIQTISEEEAEQEGTGHGKVLHFDTQGESSYRAGFFKKWISIYGIESWHENPWVWAIKFQIFPFKPEVNTNYTL